MVLLCEEMCRPISYCWWKATWWVQQQFPHALKLPEGDPIHKGMETYAKQQAAHELMIVDNCAEHWLPVQQRAKPLLLRPLGDSLPDGLDLGDPTDETVIIDIEDDKINLDLMTLD